jgi:hypothetical protein
MGLLSISRRSATRGCEATFLLTTSIVDVVEVDGSGAAVAVSLEGRASSGPRAHGGRPSKLQRALSQRVSYRILS